MRMRPASLQSVAYDGAMSDAASDAPYRAMERADLDADARELDAVAAFGRWRMGVRARALTIACVIGAVAGAVGYVVVQQIQLAAFDRAWLAINVLAGCATPFVVSLMIGLAVARVRVAAGAPRVVRELAERYRVDPSRLEEVAEMVGRL